ncbi:MAG: hypothetical protein LBN94_02355, partial [Puniceicoccales bacterium]|nr:hypothetical protein [Puniceicoccales bacterium]
MGKPIQNNRGETRGITLNQMLQVIQNAPLGTGIRNVSIGGTIYAMETKKLPDGNMNISMRKLQQRTGSAIGRSTMESSRKGIQLNMGDKLMKLLQKNQGTEISNMSISGKICAVEMKRSIGGDIDIFVKELEQQSPKDSSQTNVQNQKSSFPSLRGNPSSNQPESSTIQMQPPANQSPHGKNPRFRDLQRTVED